MQLQFVVVEIDEGLQFEATVDENQHNREDCEDGARERTVLILLIRQKKSERLFVQVKL